MPNEERVEEEEPEVEHMRAPGTGSVWGVLLLIAGIFTTTYFFAIWSVGVDGVANLDKMNLRLCGVIIGVGLFIAGCVGLRLSAIHDALMERTAEFVGMEDEDEWECTVCRAAVSEDAAVCPSCGADLTDIEDEPDMSK